MNQRVTRESCGPCDPYYSAMGPDRRQYCIFCGMVVQTNRTPEEWAALDRVLRAKDETP